MKVKIKSIREAKSLKEWFSEKDFRAMDASEQEQYLKNHPNSKFKPDDDGSKTDKNDKDTKSNDQQKGTKLSKSDLPSLPASKFKIAKSSEVTKYLQKYLDKDIEKGGYQTSKDMDIYFNKQLAPGGAAGIDIIPPYKNDPKYSMWGKVSTDEPKWTVKYYDTWEDADTSKEFDDLSQLKDYYDSLVKFYNDHRKERLSMGREKWNKLHNN